MKKLIEICSKSLGVKVNKKSCIDNTSKWDSFAHLSLIVDIENEYDFRFDTDEIKKLTSIKLIWDKLNEPV